MFRFTIRDLLWLTVVVAMGFGWWRDDRENVYMRAKMMELTRNFGMEKFLMEREAERAKASKGAAAPSVNPPVSTDNDP